MTTTTQTRGHCQLCGRQQAYLRGAIAKHGYTVDHGYFNGVCNGAQHPALELKRDATDRLLEVVAKDCAEMEAKALQLGAGEIDPPGLEKSVWSKAERNFVKVMVPYAELQSWDQRTARQTAMHRLTSRAKAGLDFIAYMTTLAANVHGKPLAEVARPAAAPRIETGEKRKLGSGSIARATRVDGARVYWTIDATARKGWTGTQAWRRMEVVA